MLSLVSFICNTTFSSELSEENIIACENQLYKAIKESDIQMLDLLLHDDLLFILPNGEIITKEQGLKIIRTG